MVVSTYCCHFLGSQYSDDTFKNLYWNMISAFLYLLLPLAGLTILWIRQDLLTNILTQIEQYYLTVAFYSFGRRKMLLNWAKRRLPRNWSSCMETLSGGIADIWSDGSLLCTLINTAIPGACPNPYRHWQKTLAHAQDVADKYLGISPVFTESELNSPLNPYSESKLLNYLTQLQKVISKVEKEKQMYPTISTRYVARGMGLYTAEQYKEAEFFIYSKIQNPSFYNVEISIFGPYSTYNRTTVLESLVRETKDSVKNKDVNNCWMKAKESYLEKLRDLGSSDIILENSILIRVEIEYDRVRVIYSSRNYGIHKINLSCNKEFIIGSPFFVNILKSSNISFKAKMDENSSTSINTKDIEEYIIKKLDIQKYESISESDPILISTHQDVQSTQGLENNPDTNTVKDNNIEDIQNNINEIKNNNNASMSLNDSKNITVELTRINDKNLISCLEISKFIKDLNKIASNKTETKKSLSTEEKSTNNTFYFSKENYSYFQRSVNTSFRKSCKITRNFPSIVQNTFPVVSGASPLCNKHTAPEDFGKLPAEEKRKIFSKQFSTPFENEPQRTDSSVSSNENLREPTSNTNNPNMKDINTNESGNLQSKLLNKNKFDLLQNIEDINKDNEDFKIVKEKKLFWETVFQTTTDHVSNDTCNKIKHTQSFHEDADRNIETTVERNHRTLKHVDSLSLLKRQNFSMSFSDLRCSRRKTCLLSYKSLDQNLDKCSNLSLNNRAQIYLENVSKKEGGGSFGNLKMVNKNNKGSKINESNEDIAKNMITLNNGDSTSNEKDKHIIEKEHFKRAIEYFKNLEPITCNGYTHQKNPSRHIKRHNTVSYKSSKEFNNSNDDDESNKSSYYGMRKNATYSKNRSFDLDFSKEETEVMNQMNVKYKRRKSMKNVFDVLY